MPHGKHNTYKEGRDRDLWIKITEILGVPMDQTKKLMQSKHEFAKLV